jgi:hypothetical protein
MVMKRLLGIFGLIVFFGLIGIVFAIIPDSYFENSKRTSGNYDYIDVSVTIHKGWNLIPTGESGHPRGECKIDDNIRSTQLKYVYYYFNNVGYIGGEINKINDDFVNEEVESELGDIFGGLDEGGILKYSLAPHWVYSSGDCKDNKLYEVRLDNTETSKEFINKIKLSKGWNFFSIPGTFIGTKFGDNLGNCVLEKANTWNPFDQDWDYNSDNSINFAKELTNLQVTSRDILQSFLIKVVEDCQLESSVSPPIIPN